MISSLRSLVFESGDFTATPRCTVSSGELNLPVPMWRRSPNAVAIIQGTIQIDQIDDQIKENAMRLEQEESATCLFGH